MTKAWKTGVWLCAATCCAACNVYVGKQGRPPESAPEATAISSGGASEQQEGMATGGPESQTVSHGGGAGADAAPPDNHAASKPHESAAAAKTKDKKAKGTKPKDSRPKDNKPKDNKASASGGDPVQPAEDPSRADVPDEDEKPKAVIQHVSVKEAGTEIPLHSFLFCWDGSQEKNRVVVPNGELSNAGISCLAECEYQAVPKDGSFVVQRWPCARTLSFVLSRVGSEVGEAAMALAAEAMKHGQPERALGYYAAARTHYLDKKLLPQVKAVDAAANGAAAEILKVPGADRMKPAKLKQQVTRLLRRKFASHPRVPAAELRKNLATLSEAEAKRDAEQLSDKLRPQLKQRLRQDLQQRRMR